METINVNVKDFSATLGEVRETVEALEKYKRMKIYESVPYGMENALSAKEIFGKDYRHLSCLAFDCGRCNLPGVGTIFRTVKKRKTIYVNPLNPNDIIEKVDTVFVYYK